MFVTGGLLTFRWYDSKSCTIFDSQGKTVRQIFRFIEGAISKGHSVLVHSVRGDSRSCLAAASYLADVESFLIESVVYNAKLFSL